MSVTHAMPQNPIGNLRHKAVVVKFGRVGWFAKGVVYTIAGLLAFLVMGGASGWSRLDSSASEEASPTGALKTIAQANGGAPLMWLLSVGLLIYAAWRVVSAMLPGGDSGVMGWIKRIGYVVSAIIYVTFAVTAISLAISRNSEPDGNAKVTSLSADVMAHTGGRIAIGFADGRNPN